MAFSWKIVDNTKDPLAEHTGPAFGQAASFQAKGYGILSADHFLYHGAIYTQTTICCNINIYIDNKGIVDRMTDQILYSYDYPVNTLEMDWDIIAQAAVTLCTYGSRLTIHQVKIHQDDNTLDDDLEFPAKLNVAADCFATQYCLQHGQVSPSVPRVEINSAQLLTTDGMISSHYTK
eukprot:3699212-Ditylum_brightwellii.AAC.1